MATAPVSDFPKTHPLNRIVVLLHLKGLLRQGGRNCGRDLYF